MNCKRCGKWIIIGTDGVRMCNKCKEKYYFPESKKAQDEKRVGKIKTFLVEKKPIEVKVFQFTKEMLPEINKETLGYKQAYITYKELSENLNIYFTVWVSGHIYCSLGNLENRFEVGDYIAEDREGNYFVIKKEEFNRDWVRK